MKWQTEKHIQRENKICHSYKMNNEMFLPIYRIIDAFKQGFQISEVILNILFISLFVIISMIIYWDIINTKVSQTSRCKRHMEMFNKNKGVYTINATDKSKQPLFDISYDSKQNNTNIECKCKTGKNINYFNNIPVRDMRKNKDVKVDKTCSCKEYYNVGVINENIVYNGEPGILRYITTGSTDFFDNLAYMSYG